SSPLLSMANVLWKTSHLLSLLTPKNLSKHLGSTFGNKYNSTLSVLMSQSQIQGSLPSHSTNALSTPDNRLFQESTLKVGNCGFTYMQTRFYQNVLRPRLICDGCYFTWRHGRKYVECSDHPRHKQSKKLCPRKVWKEDYSIGKIAKAHDWNYAPHRAFYRTVDRNVISHNWLANKIGKEV
ncbi:hypothetical protein BgiMline_017319, partial [Biomphalaria glabrata]